MYAVYKCEKSQTSGSYHFDREMALFGCRAGVIAHYVRRTVPPSGSDVTKWHVPLERLLGASGETVLIDLKPRNQQLEASLSLYEVLDVWGLSTRSWTPIMLRLRGLVIDGQPTVANSRSFEVSFREQNEPIFSFLYLNGGIDGGELKGRWTAPAASPTNSALLWPDALTYFLSAMRLHCPEAFTSSAA